MSFRSISKKVRCSATHGVAGASVSIRFYLGIIILVAVWIVAIGPQIPLVAQSNTQATPTKDVETFVRWDFKQVATLAISGDPIIDILQRERVLWSAKAQRSGQDCRLERWMLVLLDSRIQHRQEELKGDAWKLHFALAGLQAQGPVLNELKEILARYTEVAEKFKEAGLDAELLRSKLRDLESQCKEKESLLLMQLQQLRVGLKSLLRHADAETYWPVESLDIKFHQVEGESELQKARSGRSDIVVWDSFPRLSGEREEMATLQRVLAAAVPTMPMAALAAGKGVIAVSLFHSQDLRREIAQRQHQIRSLAQSQFDQLELDVAMQTIKLQNSYTLAQQSQLEKDAALTRRQSEFRMAELGAAQLRVLLESELEYQKLRSLASQRLSEARQEEIALAVLTGDREPWLTYRWASERSSSERSSSERSSSERSSDENRSSETPEAASTEVEEGQLKE